MGLELELDMRLLWLTPLGAITFHGLYFLLKHYVVRRACKALLNIEFDNSKSLKATTEKTVSNGVANGVANGANGLTKVDVATYSKPSGDPPEGVVAEIAEKSVSIFTSSTCATISIMAMYQTYDDVMESHTPLLQPMAYWMLWYWVYDLYAMCNAFCIRRKLMEKSLIRRIVIFSKCKLPLILHHFAVLFVGTPITMFSSLRNGKGDFILSCFCSHEAVNPFMHVSQIMRLLNKSHTIWFKINGVLLVLAFLIGRILLYPFMYMVYAWQYGMTLTAAISRMYFSCHLGSTFGFLLNTYWFVLILKLVKRTLMGKKQKID